MFRAGRLSGYTIRPTGRKVEATRQAEQNVSLESLLAAAQQGDRESYRRFLRAIVPIARVLARRRLGGDALVEDVVQDTLLTLHRVRHTWNPARPVRPWLAAIVDRRAIDAIRRQARVRARETFDPQALETFADPAANRDEPAAAAQTVARLMPRLSPKQQEAIELVKVREMSLIEASRYSGQSVASLKVNIHRAIRRLRALATGGEEA